MDKHEIENGLLQTWFNANVVDDVEECKTIAEMAIRECLKRWNISFGTPETVLAFYSIVYNCIVEELRTKRGEKVEFAIDIANLIQIGYDDNNDDGEQEKSGNFCPFIFELSQQQTSWNEDPDMSSIERCNQWVSENIKEQKKTINSIATAALKALVDVADIHLGSSVAIFPLFTTIHEQVVSFMKVKQADTGASEVMINFAGNFDIYCRVVEGGETVIEYSPKPSMKLGIKSDAGATAPNEE